MTAEDNQLQHAYIYYEQGRYDAAIELLFVALARDPENSDILMMLSNCFYQLGKLEEAEKHAKELLAIDPDSYAALLLLGYIALGRNRPKQALQWGSEAQTWAPDDPDVHELLAKAHASRKHWKPAVEAAEAGLREDPDHEGCLGIRSFALSQMGSHQEAREDIERSLQLNPDDGHAHANAGWSCLRQGQHQEARGHFKEALRLDPNNDWARSGLIESIKSHNVVYRIFFRFLLWMQSIPPGTFIIGMIGTVIGRHFLIELGERVPIMEIPANIIVWSIFGLFIMLMISQPISNAAIYVHPLGRLALTMRERIQSLTLIVLIVGLIAGVSFVYYSHISYMAMDAGIIGILALVPFAFAAYPEPLLAWSRALLLLVAIGLASVGVSALACMYQYESIRVEQREKLAAVGITDFNQFIEDVKSGEQTLEIKHSVVLAAMGPEKERSIWYRDVFEQLFSIALYGLVGFTWLGGLMLRPKY